MSDLFVENETLPIVDRSAMERCDECPAQAKFVADGRVITASRLTECGNAIHDVLGEVVTEYVESKGALSPSEMVDIATSYLCSSRADIQPEALDAASRSLWSWAKYIDAIHFDNVLRWDGGEGDSSGQLSWDIRDTARVTSEVDFLHTGRAPEIVTEIDYKTGFKVHTASDVEASFQFAVHAWLILNNYPDVQEVQIRVWNIRRNMLTYGVAWNRKDLYPLSHRVRAAADNWVRHRDIPAEECPTWPAVEKCNLCPAAALCPAVPADIQSLVADADGLVEAIAATEAKAEALRKLAAGIVAKIGGDIYTRSGIAFGFGKPKASRKPTASLYSVKANDEQDGD